MKEIELSFDERVMKAIERHSLHTRRWTENRIGSAQYDTQCLRTYY